MKTQKKLLKITIIAVATIWQLFNAFVGYAYTYHSIGQINKYPNNGLTAYSLFTISIFAATMLVLALYATNRGWRAGKSLFTAKNKDDSIKVSLRHLMIALGYTFLLPFVFLLVFTVVKGWLPIWVTYIICLYMVAIICHTVYAVINSVSKFWRASRPISDLYDYDVE